MFSYFNLPDSIPIARTEKDNKTVYFIPHVEQDEIEDIRSRLLNDLGKEKVDYDKIKEILGSSFLMNSIKLWFRKEYIR